MRGWGVLVCVALLGARTARADEPQSAPSVTVAPPAATPAPATPAPAPPSQAVDPDLPPRPVPEASTSRSAARTSEGELVAGEILVAALVMTGLGVPGYYAAKYEPTHDSVPQPTTASNAIEVLGIAAILAAPAFAGQLVCRIGRWSSTNDGTCGWAVGLAYVGLLVPSFTWLATAGKPPPNCDECAIPGPSVPAVLTAYIVGVTAGAVLGWNLSKHPRDEEIVLQPIFRAGPPPAEAAAWTDLLQRSPSPAAPGVAWTAIAFAF